MGIDTGGIDEENMIKSHWRHVKSRFYFSSASHMYTLLNVIKFGMKETLKTGDSDFKLNNVKINDIGRMDFLSGFYFRVFENFNVSEHDPARFKLDIRVNRGSILENDKILEIENHTIPIKIDESFTKSLTLEDIDFFFNTLLDMSVSTATGG